MLSSNKQSPGVKILGDSVARRIAAGEVIERPASVVRELLDNSIDAGAGTISLYLEDGGISKIRIVDDGSGMSAEDLELCWLPHATSKMREVKDLQSVSTLGFRGEALSSVASCSQLKIISFSQQDDNCNILEIYGGKMVRLQPHPGRKGTVIDVSELFYSIPARKRFLKGASTESRMCRKSFLDKALPFPELEFKLFTDNKLKLLLSRGTLKERVTSCYSSHYSSSNLTLLENSYEDFSLKIVAAGPQQKRKDRKHIKIFANRRPIDEYAFVQAVEYGFSNYMPGGAFPSAFVFIEVNPALVDFNIHPAKREARFHIKQKIHHAVVETILDWLKREHFQIGDKTLSSSGAGRQFPLDYNRNSSADSIFSRQNKRADYSNPAAASDNRVYSDKRDSVGFQPLPKEVRRDRIDYSGIIPGENSSNRFNNDFREMENSGSGFKYHGQIFSVFLLVEIDNRLIILDQHAAHERILYNQFVNGNYSRQELLIPVEIELDSSEEDFLNQSKHIWEDAGYYFTRKGSKVWELKSIPGFADKLNIDIMEILKGCGGNVERLERELYADAACKKAVKEGEILDHLTAEELIEKALSLPEPRCPHGRPVWFEVSKSELYQLVGRDPV